MDLTIRCSQLARPMTCAGFLFLKDLPKSEENPAAKEGTAAGEYLERTLLGMDMPAQARNGVYFDDDMKFYVKPIAEEINALRESDVRCEQRIDWQTRSGIWIRGTYDVSFTAGDALYIDDLKYGWGIVEVRDNWQLIAYAIGETIRLGIAFPKIILRIRQPRPHHEDGDTREWVLTYAELLALKERIEVRMEMIAAGDKTLTTSKNCKHCGGAAEACPAFNRLFYRALEVSTEFTQDQIDETELSRQLDHVGRAQEVIKIKQDSLNELAVSRIRGGKIIPGYITEDSYGYRQWKGGISPEIIETLTGKKVVEQVMLSPAKAEKLGIPKDFIKSLVEQKFLGQKVKRKNGSDLGNKLFGRQAPT